MSEAVSLKRPRSASNSAEEPEEKYNGHATNPQLLLNHTALANIPVTSARGAQPSVGFPLMQYCQMIQQMQHQQMEFPIAMLRKDKDDASTTSSSSRRQTISTPSLGPRPIRVPPQSIFNPLQFGLLPHVPQFTPQVEDKMKTPSPAAVPRPQTPQHIYNIPSFQRADEEIYSKFVDSVRKLAAKLSAERS